MRTTLVWTLILFTLSLLILSPHVALAQAQQGERPIVRLVYLSGGNPQPNIDAKLDALIKDTQQFFADQMEAHGFDRKTFLYETDAHGKAVVYHEPKNFPRPDYLLVLYESKEFLQIAGLQACGVAWTPGDGIGGNADIPSRCFDINTFAHELGHLFGLPHDYRTSGTWIPTAHTDFAAADKMVTSFAAAQWLDVHPAFNTGGNSINRNTTIKMLPPSLVSPSSNAIRLRFEVTDPDGLHQAQLTSRAIDRFPALLDYEGLNGSTDSTLEFVIPDPAIFDGNAFDVSLRVIDMQGNILHSSTYRVNTTFLLPPSEVMSSLDSHSEVRVQHRIGERRSQDTTWGLPEGAITRLGKGGINQVAYSPDGTRLAVAGSAGILLYDTRTYQEVSFFSDTGHGRVGYSVSFSPDGKTLASADYNSISLWRVETGQRLRTLTVPDLEATCVAFSPDGKTLASIGNGIVHLWDVDTGNLLHTLVRKRHHVGNAIQGVSPLRVVFSPDGKILASTTIYPYDLLQLWDVETGHLLHTLEHENYFNDIAFSPDGKMIASAIGGRDGHILYFWDVETGQRLRTFTEHGYNINSIAFSPDRQTLAIGSSYTIRGNDGGDLTLWDLDTGTLLHTLVGHGYYIIDVAFSPDGQTLTSASGEGTLRFWNVETGQLLHTFDDYTNNIHDVAFSPDGRILATVSGDRDGHAGTDPTIRLWDIGTRSLLYKMTGHPFYSVDFSPDGQIFASGSHDGTIGLWDINTGRLLRTLTGHARTVKTLFSPDGQILASGSHDGTIGLWDINTGRLLHALQHTLPVFDISFSLDGQMLASVSFESHSNVDNIILWDVDTGKRLDPAMGMGSYEDMDLSPDGKTLAASGYGRIHLWDVETRSSLHTFRDDSWHIFDVAFSPDGKTLAAVVFPSSEGVLPHIQFWDVETRSSLRTLTGHNFGHGPHGYAPLAFSPDGQTLASAGRDNTVLLWNLAPTPPEPARVTTDVNGDGEVNIQDLAAVAAALGQAGENDADVNGDGEVNIQDLAAVAAALGEVAAAPAIVHQQGPAHLTQEEVQHWLTLAQQANLTDATSVRGIRFLKQLLAAFIPKETALLPNYPNPFNPETWIPYQLATPAEVSLKIYDIQGRVVRDLDLGHQRAGMYHTRSRAAYWDGRNAVGEPVASGVYFYTLSTESTRDSVTAGEFTATRKLLIRK
ncbi:T9SS type A sorting domain-containing protein [Candidatus Poribacteria bacterium]|nr:T9SS type A sorting domain-containing protein [Candidatus Poribacteria bacterium]MYK23818.1 T9SS type A sorting domain-containing protein [Candidatus Poribacteria bacterium]